MKQAPVQLPAEERKLWKQILNEYPIDDRPGELVLQTGLEAHARMRQCRELIEAQGMTTVDRFGQLRAHPLLSAERDARAQFLMAFRQLDLRPEDYEPAKNGRPARGI